MNPKVTVIIPMHNAEPYLAECLDSVIGQSLNDIEIICVDDASSDASRQICDSYASSDERIKVLGFNINVGAASARNRAIKEARGEYVAFIDADDWYPSSTALERLYCSAVENNAMISGGSLTEYDSNENKVISDYSGRGHLEAYQFTQSGMIEYVSWQSDLGWIRFIYNRNFLIVNGITFPSLARHEDPVFLVKAMLAAKRFYAIPDAVYCYRIFHKPLKLSPSDLRDAFAGMSEVMLLASEHGLKTLEQWTVESFIWYSSLSETIQGVFDERDALRRENEALRARCNASEAELADIKNSRSYQIGEGLATPVRLMRKSLHK